MIVGVKTDPGYDVVIEPGASRRLPALAEGADRVAIVRPAALAEAADALAATLDKRVVQIEIPDAEAAKTPRVLADAWDALAAATFTRNDLVVGLGGGATTDLAGFIAATWLRGVRYVAVPTSVLAAVDAAVGGKTGINLSAGKNLVGAFYEPAAVLCDLDLLATLPPDEVSSGLAEVIKCGFIADTAILDLVAEDPDDARNVASDRLADLVARAVRVKADVVAADLRESTSTSGNVGREALNYGHTLGHAIEKTQDYTWRHGAAISVGMVWAAEVSRRLLGLDHGVVQRHRDLLSAVGLPTRHDGDWPELRSAMSIDKKARGSALRLIGLTAPGHVDLITAPDEAVLADAYRALS